MTLSSASSLLDIGAVAEMLSVSPRTVRRMADAGQMPKAVKLGGKLVRWRPDEIAEWIQAGCPRTRTVAAGTLNVAEGMARARKLAREAAQRAAQEVKGVPSD